MGIDVRRRQFISVLGGAAAWPLAARARLQFSDAGSPGGFANSGGTTGSIYPFPNALNTGVPAGTTLIPYAGPSTITTDGTVIDGASFTKQLAINANNVTVQNCYFAVAGTCVQVGSANNPNVYTNTTIENCEMAGETPPGAGNLVNGANQAVQGSQFSVLGCNIHGYAKCINCEGSNITVKGCYLWNESDGGPGAHLENIICDGVGSNFHFVNNTIVNTRHQTTTIFVSTDFGPTDNVSIEGNILYGGGDYTIYAGTTATQTNIFIVNNVMANAAQVTGGYGYAYPGGKPATIWRGNVDFFTGQIISPANYRGTRPTLIPNPQVVIQSFEPSNSFIGDSPTFAQYLATSNIITLKGCTLAGNSVSVFDGATLLGTTTAHWRTGVWTFRAPQTGTLAPGLHRFTAKDTTANTTSAVFNVTIP